MEILKSRKAAFIVLLVVILLFTPLASFRSLSRAVDSIESMFYSGVEVKNKNYSPNTHLSSVENAARGLITVSSEYTALDNDTEAARKLLNSLIDSDGISDKYASYAPLMESCESLYKKLTALEDISNVDLDNADAYMKKLTGASGAIDATGYNKAVDDFTQNTMQKFPANIIAGIFGIDAPESFGG